MARVQVLPAGGNWKISVDGDERGNFDTQREAEQQGRQIAQQMGAEFQLHGTSGEIREKDSYGNDPSNIPG